VYGHVFDFYFFRLINEIIEFDQKIQSLLPPVKFNDRQWLFSKTNWKYILISIFIYFLGYKVLDIYIFQPKKIDMYTVAIYFFGKPYITDYVVFITVYFFLINIGYRYQTINIYWKSLPDGLITVPGEFIHHEIVILIDDIRILHTRLSEILKLFNLGYGLLLLYFFVFNFFDLLYSFYILIKHEFAISNYKLIDLLHFIPTHLYRLQAIVFLMSIIVASSWIIEEVQLFYNKCQID